jgi:hypothetical protein
MAKSKDMPKGSPKPVVPSSKNKFLIWAIFLPTFIVVLLSLTSVVFPALLTRATSPFQGEIASPGLINPFEPGVLAVPLVIVNLLILGIGYSYFKKKTEIITKIILRISNLEVSRKQALVGVIILVAVFVIITGGTLANEETWVDYKGVKERLQTWTISDFTKGFEPHLRYLLLSISQSLFGNIRVIPFLTSIALLLLTYFFTKKITQKRFAGLVSMGLLLQSQIFTTYGTTASYDNSWIILFLFSLFLIQKFWPPSPVSFFLSIFSKAFTVAFLPMTLYFIARSNLPMRSKIISLVSYGIIIIIMLLVVTIFKTNIVGTNVGYASQFWQGFSAMSMQMRFDYVIILFLLPLTVMLFFAAHKGILHADSMMVFILSILLAAPFLLAFTDQTNQPYRFVSLSVFFAIGVGLLFSKSKK